MNHEQACWNYLKLASVADQKGQWLPRNRLLLMVSITAARAGWLDLADKARQLLIASNPRHPLNSPLPIANSLNQESVQSLIDRYSRQVNYERAEHLVLQSHDAQNLSPETSEYQACLELFHRLSTNTTGSSFSAEDA
ncbi:hypothetical protein Spb1_30690 [Planctopirus ephydatiae]|uniref:Uncharacterized protein n=1 Tax=Planctopirus ephydatiae TaxID=2528019 RepID=A0A518GRH9_9PLAN|nr:hypothetical protein [Planctopirus ephydatiae]QDV31131.1 hypothetical protein Spb1_30690 [Planctopirus ephydatiae]